MEIKSIEDGKESTMQSTSAGRLHSADQFCLPPMRPMQVHCLPSAYALFVQQGRVIGVIC